MAEHSANGQRRVRTRQRGSHGKNHQGRIVAALLGEHWDEGSISTGCGIGGNMV